MEHKIMLVFFVLACLIPGSVQATCLDSNQIYTIGKIAEQANVSTSDLLSIFDMLCERGDSAAAGITAMQEALAANMTEMQATVTNATEEMKQNFTAMLEEQIDIAQAINRLADIMNETSQADAIKEMIDKEIVRIGDETDERFSEFRYELDSFTTEGDLDKMYQNITAYTNMKVAVLQQQQRQQPMPNETYYIAAAVLAVIGIAAYYKRKEKKKRDDAYNKVRHMPRQDIQLSDREKDERREMWHDGKVKYREEDIQQQKELVKDEISQQRKRKKKPEPEKKEELDF